MRYQAVMFDLFGTLVDFSPREHDRVLAEMAAVLGVPYHVFARVWPTTYALQEQGLFSTIEAVLEHICREAAAPSTASRITIAAGLYLDFQRRTLTPRSDAVEVLAWLKGAGYRTGLISNCPAVVKVVWGETRLAPLIDVAIFSFDVGLRKPDPRIYQLVCERLCVPPQHCLYIGDGGSRELSGAAVVGMQAALLSLRGEDPDDARYLGRETWQGITIVALKEVLGLVKA